MFQVRAHLWNRKKKVYDLIFRLCSCNCGHGFLTREEEMTTGQTKPNQVKKSRCKVASLKPELKNEMVKKKPAFHWNKPPKPDLVKTTFFEAKREDFRDFETPEKSDSPIPGLQIADFTVSRARVVVVDFYCSDIPENLQKTHR